MLVVTSVRASLSWRDAWQRGRLITPLQFFGLPSANELNVDYVIRRKLHTSRPRTSSFVATSATARRWGYTFLLGPFSECSPSGGQSPLSNNFIHISVAHELLSSISICIYSSNRLSLLCSLFYRTMFNPNIFAILTPVDDKGLTKRVFGLPENADWFHEAIEELIEESTIGSREATPALLTTDEDVEAVISTTDRIILTFDKPPNNPLKRWQFGTSKASSNVFLGHRRVRAISA